MKIYFLCYKCFKYNSVNATKENLDWYDGIGDDITYCPTCDDEQPCIMDIGRKPPMPLTVQLGFH